jgi:hypothetical protein
MDSLTGGSTNRIQLAIGLVMGIVGTVACGLGGSFAPTPAAIRTVTPVPVPTATSTLRPTPTASATPTVFSPEPVEQALSAMATATSASTQTPISTRTPTASPTPSPSSTATATWTATPVVGTLAPSPDAAGETEQTIYRFRPLGPAQPDLSQPCPGCPRAPGYIVGRVVNAAGQPLPGVRLVCYNEWYRYPVVGTKGSGEYDFPTRFRWRPT